MNTKLSPRLQFSIAKSLDAEKALLPLLPELLRDLEDLGARAEIVSDVLQAASLSPGDTGLDLGCGKGAAALAVSERFGVRMEGIDGLPEFVRHANQAAQERGLADRCRFSWGDLRARASAGDLHQLVMMLAVGDVLGSTQETVAALRRLVRPGGYLLIDDAYLADGTDAEAYDLEDCLTHAQMLEALQAHGDTLVCERVVDGPSDRAYYEQMTHHILARCRGLAARKPEVAALVMDFAERQRDELALLEGPVVGALWLLQRA